MEILTRKQREIQQRETQILALARPMLVQDGYQSLSMDRLASMMEYAKGTLYNHFPNKEEIVAALAIESLELRKRLFEAAAVSSPKSRLRLSAIGSACDLYATEFRDHLAIEMMLRNEVIWDKSSEKRQQLVRRCELNCMQIVSGIVRDAVAAGDLTLPPNMAVEEFVFGFWSLTYGSHYIAASSPSLVDVGVAQPLLSIRYHCWTLMNGYGWLPMMSFEDVESFRSMVVEKMRRHASK